MSVALVYSKTRVASLKKQLTMPKLKLSGALLTMKLLKSVAKDLKIPVTHISMLGLTVRLYWVGLTTLPPVGKYS